MPEVFPGIKAFTETAKTAATSTAKTRDRGAVYGEKFKPGMLGKAGALQPVGRDKPSRGYSVVRAALLALDRIDPRDAAEEMEAHHRLKKLYGMKGFTPSSHKSILVVGSTAMMRDQNEDGSDWFEMKEFKREIGEKMRASLPDAIDHDHPGIKAFNQKALGITTETAGGSFVAAAGLGEFIELQRNFESFSRAGARDYPIPPNGRINLPKMTGNSTAQWVGEANTVADSQPTTGVAELMAKKIAVITTVSDELQRFSDPTIEALLRNDHALQAGLLADTAMYTGTGGTQIKGLLTYPTSTTWTQGTDAVITYTASKTDTNGDTYQPQDIMKMPALLPDPVQAMPKSALIFSPTSAVLMARRADAVTAADQAGPFVFQINRDPGTGLPNIFYGDVRIIPSYNVPHNRVKGSGTNLTVVVIGAFQEWFIGRASVVEFMANPYSNFAQVQTQLRTVQYIDAVPRHLASFVYCDNILPTT